MKLFWSWGRGQTWSTLEGQEHCKCWSPWSLIQFSLKSRLIVALLLNCWIGLTLSLHPCSVNFILSLAGLYSAQVVPSTKHPQIWRIKIPRPFALHQQWRKLALTTDNLLFNMFLINIKNYVRLFSCGFGFF